MSLTGTPLVTDPDPVDVTAVEHVVGVFFAAFTSGPDLDDRLDDLRSVLHPRAVVVRTCGQPVEVYDVESFLAPRRTLLASGRLRDFREWPTGGRVDVVGDLAQWFGTYEKAWVEGGVEYAGRGAKSVQLARLPEGWRITAAIWDDEREGVALP
ncbi:DUF4440 domain-containing protein [Lapillicoccus jejuensis]|uniref:Uncharacterized protein DUF4440 n=1 Tax=Lapillicoccus jejuensis TaxID=402171 RepID=A0A542E5L3_9MICO|nr:DUF4440 domain-containing protein [Lapillicoccus jejuensis]TQJ10628.1 uncharacterized protein DUF4440 [Lapillicoccus jejuensis]